jgi:chaperonin cofactor prefoldin
MVTDRLERDVSVLQDTISSLRDELRSKESVIHDLHRQCESYEAKFDTLQNVSRSLKQNSAPEFAT